MGLSLYKVIRRRTGRYRRNLRAGGLEEATGMNQKDSNKGFDTDIMQCKMDILRAHQSAALSEIKKHKDNEKEPARSKPQAFSEEKNPSPAVVGKSSQSAMEKKIIKTELKSDLPARKQRKDITKKVQAEQINTTQTKSTPAMRSPAETWVETVKIEEEPPRAVEGIGAIRREISESVATKEKSAEILSDAKRQREEKLSENAEYAQSNEVQFIQQIKSIRAGGNQTGRQEVPRFNLAEQIMAEQRKSSSVKRKAPSSKIAVEQQQVNDEKSVSLSEQEAIREEKQISPVQQEIITRIVGQDIERLFNSGEQRGRKNFDDQRF